jgi:uncharacterized BrkB/YihY/UPF0761 family membrane protein
MKTKTKCALFTILWMFVFFLCTAVAYLIVGSLLRHRADLPQYPLLYSLMPFTPLLMAGLALLISRFGWLPGTKNDDRNAA